MLETNYMSVVRGDDLDGLGTCTELCKFVNGMIPHKIQSTTLLDSAYNNARFLFSRCLPP
jgi:hypothetical protein